jgi:hypothetical protein
VCRVDRVEVVVPDRRSRAIVDVAHHACYTPITLLYQLLSRWKTAF